MALISFSICSLPGLSLGQTKTYHIFLPPISASLPHMTLVLLLLLLLLLLVTVVVLM